MIIEVIRIAGGGVIIIAALALWWILSGVRAKGRDASREVLEELLERVE